MPIDFEEKARENLRAANHLLPDEGNDDGLLGEFPNASATRAYYAAYHAVAHRAQADRRAFTSGKNYYKHDDLPDDAYGWHLLNEDGRESLEQLRDLRIKADYFEDHVSILEAAEATTIAEGLVDQLLGPEENQ